jgi:hypothetical protein
MVKDARRPRASSTRENTPSTLGMGRNTATPGRKTLAQLGFPVLQMALRGVLRPSAARASATPSQPGGCCRGRRGRRLQHLPQHRLQHRETQERRGLQPGCCGVAPFSGGSGTFSPGPRAPPPRGQGRRFESFAHSHRAGALRPLRYCRRNQGGAKAIRTMCAAVEWLGDACWTFPLPGYDASPICCSSMRGQVARRFRRQYPLDVRTHATRPPPPHLSGELAAAPALSLTSIGASTPTQRFQSPSAPWTESHQQSHRKREGGSSDREESGYLPQRVGPRTWRRGQALRRKVCGCSAVDEEHHGLAPLWDIGGPSESGEIHACIPG